ncbi:AraC family transcriptional regulator [Niabella sp. CC-SYL272]|uniref:AraC family transcriptional regulator n=1 Tax=Niabella agricola TaxID=2891571 RepID=UPI001F199F6C|nr:AraC family transcriptional regulator [Niabella agricola]MCF3108846.1 AraC family transcriptional regulator [Niabella agricola]
MKLHFHKVPVPLQDSFSIRHDRAPNFGRPLHYHPELELHFTIKGTGIRLIGDDVSHFKEGEVILLGENLPHAWRGKENGTGDAPEDSWVEAIVIQFSADCLGADFFQLPEAYLLPRIFELAKKGLLFYGELAEQIKALMYRSVKAARFERILILLQILQVISEREEFSTIASAHAFYKPNEHESVRLNNVLVFTLANFKREITLDEVAAVSNLSVTSFCRYFKMITNKTYLDFLTEVRISHTRRMIIEDRYPIAMICYECGFNNVSNFYRHFKRFTGMTPFEYKKRYNKELSA